MVQFLAQHYVLGVQDFLPSAWFLLLCSLHRETPVRAPRTPEKSGQLRDVPCNDGVQMGGAKARDLKKK